VKPGDLDSVPPLYRFLYMDFERVRSLAAMLFGGVPENSADERSIERSVGGKVHIGIPGLPGGEAGGEVLYINTGKETRSLHHHLLRAVVRRLDELDVIANVTADDELPKGKFIRLSAEVVIRDFAAIIGSMEAMVRTVDAIAEFQTVADREAARTRQKQKQAGTPTAPNPPQTQSQSARDLQKSVKSFLPPLTDAIESLYGDTIRLYCRVGERLYVAPLTRANLVEPPQPGIDPTTVGGLWTVLCEAEFGDAELIDLGRALSSMEQGVEKLIQLLQQLGDLMKPKDAPLLRPIAVYREL
jgi:hypothetical protein